MAFPTCAVCSIFRFLFQVWPHKEYPLIPVGKIVLDRNPKNYFAEVEQLAFAPSHMIPGVEPSCDKMLQVSFNVEWNFLGLLRIVGKSWGGGGEIILENFHDVALLLRLSVVYFRAVKVYFF